MSMTTMILQILFGIMFTSLGVLVLVRAKIAMGMLNQLKLPNWFCVLTGIVELIGGVSMLAGIWNAYFAVFAGVWLGITMLVGAALHLRVKQPITAGIPAIVIGLLSFTVFIIKI